MGGGLSFQVYLYDPTESVLTTWDKSYSFDIGPGRSYKVALSARKYNDYSGYSGCIPEGEMGYDWCLNRETNTCPFLCLFIGRGLDWT